MTWLFHIIGFVPTWCHHVWMWITTAKVGRKFHLHVVRRLCQEQKKTKTLQAEHNWSKYQRFRGKQGQPIECRGNLMSKAPSNNLRCILNEPTMYIHTLCNFRTRRNFPAIHTQMRVNFKAFSFCNLEKDPLSRFLCDVKGSFSIGLSSFLWYDEIARKVPLSAVSVPFLAIVER